MSSSQKQKGSQWERDCCKLQEELINGSEWRRVALSGAMGTILHETTLMGDIKGIVPGLYKHILGECKVGYGGKDQLTIKRDWLRNTVEDAQKAGEIPVLFCNFSGAKRDENKYFVVLPNETFALFMLEIGRYAKIEEELTIQVEAYKEKYGKL
jgi:hypothetical protein